MSLKHAYTSVKRLPRTFGAIKSALGVTDRERWKNPDDLGYLTAERNELIAALIPAGSSVLDMGAGIQQLRQFLPHDCEYQPCDLDGGPEVLSCDFNADLYPSVTHRYDILVASGLAEFLRAPEAFLAHLPVLGDTLLISYRVRPPGESLWRRLDQGYLSHLTSDEIEEMFSRLGYRWEPAGVYQFHSGRDSHVQPIYRVDLRSSPSAGS